MNKDEAERCLEISKKKYHEGDTIAAIKFAEKSIRLHESENALKWFSFIKANPKKQTQKTSNDQKVENKPNSKPDTRPYTQEQVAGIKKILAYKSKGDLYGVLGLEKSCSDNDIKKAYRKAALKFHPDKCGAPALSHAWTVLGETDKRSNYDRFGIDSESNSRGGGGGGFHPGFGHGFGGHHQFQGELSPEDLIRMFMGGGAFGGMGGPGFAFNAGPQFRTRTRNAQHNAAGDNLPATVFQLLPILLLILLTAVSIFSSEDDPFSFRQSYDYNVEKVSKPNNIKYYVNAKSYQKRFPSTRKQKQLNDQVEGDYLQHIRIQCSRERETQSHYIRQANSWFSVDKDLLERAQKMDMPNCAQLKNWK
ncbi:DnaJ (Hsp40), sub B, member 12 [Globomyces sp. JEL0801]|nr:DnaJ (Hsp40), sub B, member 12 [Globomyces sp. JEL0801]